MKLCEFETLSRGGQVSVLYRKGVYIGKGKKGALTTVLYQVDTFYVEVFYQKYRFDIQAIRCFSTTRELDPYLSQIAIEPLVYP